MVLRNHPVQAERLVPLAALAASLALSSALGCSGGELAVGDQSSALTAAGSGSDPAPGDPGPDAGPPDDAPPAPLDDAMPAPPADAPAAPPADAAPADGPEVAPPPREAPYSRVEISYDDGHPTSILSTPPSVDTRCWIPKEILADKPIYPGDPVMTDCQVRMSVIGQPPTSIDASLSCRNGYIGDWDSFDCSQSITFVPPGSTTTGSFSYASGKSVKLDAATCAAYITRALSICQVTGR